MCCSYLNSVLLIIAVLAYGLVDETVCENVTCCDVVYVHDSMRSLVDETARENGQLCDSFVCTEKWFKLPSIQYKFPEF